MRDLAVLTAVGVNQDGKREILGVSVSLSEHEVNWRNFLESLKALGLGGVQLITSDDHAGLRAARLAAFRAIPLQRCQFHLQQNAQAYVPRKEMQTELAEDISTIFNAPDRTTAETYLARVVEKYQKTASRLTDGWLKISRKVLRFSPFQSLAVGLSALPTVWNDCIERYAVGLV